MLHVGRITYPEYRVRNKHSRLLPRQPIDVARAHTPFNAECQSPREFELSHPIHVEPYHISERGPKFDLREMKKKKTLKRDALEEVTH